MKLSSYGKIVQYSSVCSGFCESKRSGFHIYIFFVALVLYSIHAYFCPILFFPDSEQYVRSARGMLWQNGGEFYYYRTLGYPFFLNLFGVTTLDTFYVVLVVQLLFAAAIPSIVYLTLCDYPKAAFWAAVLTLVSFSPAYFSNLIMTDQVAMFFRYLLIYVASLCVFNSPGKKVYIALCGIGFALFCLRPADALTFVIILSGLLLFRAGDWRKLVLVLLCFFAMVYVGSKIRDMVANQYTKSHGITSTSVVGSMTGKMLFFNVYAVGPKLTKKPTFDPDNGPNSKALYDALVAWGKANPMGVNSYSIQGGTAFPELYGAVKTPEQFADALIAEQGLFAHSVMWLALDQQIGGYKADNIFFGAAIESYLSNPVTIMLLYDGIIEFFLSGDVVYNSGKREVWGYRDLRPIEVIRKSVVDFASTDRLNKEIRSSIESYAAWMHSSRAALFFWIVAIKICAVLVGLAFLPATFVSFRQVACLSAIFAVLLVYHAAVAVAFASPHFRYTLPHVPLLIMLGALGVNSFVCLLRRARQAPHPTAKQSTPT